MPKKRRRFLPIWRDKIYASNIFGPSNFIAFHLHPAPRSKYKIKINFSTEK
jgi:hypothetical protein